LEKRYQYVKFENVFSNKVNVTSGVPQGGVASPLLYNLFVADLPNYLNSFVYQFADDVVLLMPIKSNDDVLEMQNDLDDFYNYCNENSLKLNSTKTKHLRISFKKHHLNNYLIDTVDVESVKQHKHLGLIFDDKLLFNAHTDYLITKAYKKFYTLKNCCKNVNAETLLKMYCVYVLPIIEYSNCCWTPTNTQIEKLEKIQKKITKSICKKLNRNEINYEDRIKLLNLKSLSFRRKIQLLKTVFYVKNNDKSIPDSWFSELNFYENRRNGILIDVPFIRI
jgi:hypothetical protein